MQTDETAETNRTPAREQRIRFLVTTFRRIHLVVFLIFVFAIVQTFTLWQVCNTGMKTAVTLEHQGLPALKELASLQENLALYGLESYEYLFAQEAQKAGEAKAADDIALQMRAELKNIQALFPEGEGRQLALNLEKAVDDLDIQFKKVRGLVDSDFPAAMKSMDQDIPPRTKQVNATANALKEFGYQFSGAQANATFAGFGWIKSTAVMFGIASSFVVFCAFVFVLLAARRSRAQLAETLARLDERTREVANSQALYQSLVDQMPAGVFRKDMEGRFVFVNSWYCKLKGVKPDRFLGKTPSEVAASETAVPGANHPVLMSEAEIANQGVNDHAEILQTRRIIEREEQYSDPDGKVHYLRVIKSPVFDPDGKITGTQGMLFDITDRKQAEAELAYERDLLRSLLDSSPDQIYFKDAQSRFIKSSQAQAENFGLKSADELVGKTDFDFFTEEHARPAFEDEQEIIRTGHPLIGRVEKEVWKDGRETWVLTNKIPLRDKGGQIIGTFGISKDITVIKQAEAELAYQRDLLETLMNHSPDSIFFKDRQSRFVKLSRSEANNLLRVSLSHYRTSHPADGEDSLPPHLASVEEFEKYVIGKSDAEIYGEERAGDFAHDEEKIMRTGQPMIGKIEQTICPDGSIIWFMTTKVPWRSKDETIIGTFGTAREISDLKNAETKLAQVHKQLLETSRLAGMAEIATNVLHNVGNVLNSVNVSASLVVDSVKKSKTSSLAKVVTLLREHEHDLGIFFTSDPRGKQLSKYLAQLSEQLLADQKTTVHELDLLVKNIEHIKDIVTMQQTYARVSGVKEIINLRELVEDSLRMNVGALGRHRVEVIREFEDVPLINIDKHKVLQVLVNLIRNAKHACQDSERTDKRLTVRVANGDGRIKISIMDNGVGIPPENLTRIFSHGFTTRKDGHGFGLHSGALAAKEMGGTLAVHSDGPGQGATFTLDLPCDTNKDSHE